MNESKIDLLKKCLESFQAKQSLKPGDIVRWKDNMKNKRFPPYGQPAIVVQIIDPPIISTDKETGSTYYREPYDFIIGVLDEEGTFLLYHSDSRRFELFKL